ncbi:MAG TPA: CDP-alcohol phosphatidyltransferase family protein [Vicinamibacterales bacterium]|nr:CDP-alcohol phosphatidyltransferase family protein [Vicinamibacterales bacterium]
MSMVQFAEATRVASNPLVGLERRCLIWLAQRLPRAMNSDHLTALALAAMALTGASYAVAPGRPVALLVAIVGLALNWFGDSLDGTLARVRGQQRPRYGFYVDHVVDCFGVVFVLAGLGWSGFMTPGIAMTFLIAYLMLSIEIYLATYCLTVFRLSFWGVGPTELRLLLAVGTIALVNDPQVLLFGREYQLFDVGGVVGTIGLLITFVVSVARNTRTLYEAEPLR